MFRRGGAIGVVILAAAASAALPATASASTPLGPCTIGNPSSCTFHPRPNITVFCGTERTYGPFPGTTTHYFRGCRVRVGAATAECGEANDNTFDLPYRHSHLTGCAVTFGVNRVVVGCESHGEFVSGYSEDHETCGVSPVATCTTDNVLGYTNTTTTTCGREPVVLRCVDQYVNFPSSETHYCEFVIGSAATPIFSCRFDSANADATVADVTGCLTGLGARRR